MKKLILLFILILSVSGQAFAATIADELGAADDLIVDGKYVDVFKLETLNVQPGAATHRFLVSSTVFDTYLTLVSPDGETWVDDDFEGSTAASSLTVQLSQSSPWFLVVSSYSAGERGAYTLESDPDIVLEKQSAFSSALSQEFLQNTGADTAEVYAAAAAAPLEDIADWGRDTDLVFSSSVESEHETTARVAAYEVELESQGASAEEVELELERYASEQWILASETRMPEFPWPPPHASAAQVLDRDVLLNAVADADTVTLRDIDQALSNALASVGYSDKSYYSVPNGFAMVTRLEQTDIDGVPLEALARWSTSIPVMQAFSLRTYISALFGTNVGYFRILAFIVTSHTFAQASEEVNVETALTWVSDGGNAIPDAVRSMPFDEKYNVTVLVYEFEKLHGDDETQVKIPGRLSSQNHLQRSGIMTALGD